MKAQVELQKIDPLDARGFVVLTDMIPDAMLDIRYYSSYNFIGERIRGYEEPVALITKKAGRALKAVSDELLQKGYRLKIFDTYRPQMAVDHFNEWLKDLSDIRMKQYFYPELDKSVLYEQGYFGKKSGHSRGSVVDLTLFDMRTGQDVDMGGNFDYFGEISHPDHIDGLTEAQLANRKLLSDTMVQYGFEPLDTEWWHFKFIEEPFPNTYFNFPIKRLEDFS